MKRISMLAILVLVFGLLPVAFAQQAQPAQPTDPTAQAPATPAPTTPPTFPESKGKSDTQQSPEARQSQDSSEASQGVRVFIGSIGQGKDGYVLRAADKEYKLDDQAKAKEFNGKQVKVQGNLDHDKNVIHVQKIEESPSM